MRSVNYRLTGQGVHAQSCTPAVGQTVGGHCAADHTESSGLAMNNKFHNGNGSDGKHYWLTPKDMYAALDAEHHFDFDPCPFPLPPDFDGLTCEWGESNYVNPPFGSIMHGGKKKGPTAWVRKALAERAKGKRVVFVYPIDKWILMLLAAGVKVQNLGDVRWLSTEDRLPGKGTGRHIACFILEPGPKEKLSGGERATNKQMVGEAPQIPDSCSECGLVNTCQLKYGDCYK